MLSVVVVLVVGVFVGLVVGVALVYLDELMRGVDVSPAVCSTCGGEMELVGWLGEVTFWCCSRCDMGGDGVPDAVVAVRLGVGGVRMT